MGGVFLPKLRSLSLRVSACGLKAPRAVFAANPPDKVVDAFAGMSGPSNCYELAYPNIRSGRTKV